MPARIGSRRVPYSATIYLLCDRFDNPLAAGSVNGTNATPGPGVRAVTDTESKLSITGSVLSFAGGKASPVWGDPGLWYPAQTRVAGKVLLAKIVNMPTTALIKEATGWGTAQSGLMAANVLALNVGNLRQWDNSSGDIIVGVYASSTTYSVAHVLRATGAFHIIKGGAFTNWTLVWITGLNSTSTLYPGILSYNAAFAADNILVPATLWLPAPLASDSFTRADGALGTCDGSGHAEKNGGAGLAWTGATWTISSNAAINTPTVNATLNSGTLTIGSWYKIVTSQTNYFYTGSAANDVFVATAATALDANNTVKLLTLSELLATVPALSTADTVTDVAPTITGNVSGGIVCNLDSISSPANFVLAYYNKQSGKCCLDEYVAGARTSKIATTATYAAGAVCRVVRSGTEARLFYNDVAIGTVQTMTTNTNKISGMFSTDSGVVLDNFVAWPRGTSGEYESLGALIT